MAGVFSRLKWHGVNCEQAPEFAKEKVWEESFKLLHNQIYIFGKQHHTLFRLSNKVECVVTDSPLLLSLIYGENQSSAFKALVREEYSKYLNINVFLRRQKQYNPSGRMQTEEEAQALDVKIRRMLEEMELDFHEMDGKSESVDVISNLVLSNLGFKSRHPQSFPEQK